MYIITKRARFIIKVLAAASNQTIGLSGEAFFNFFRTTMWSCVTLARIWVCYFFLPFLPHVFFCSDFFFSTKVRKWCTYISSNDCERQTRIKSMNRAFTGLGFQWDEKFSLFPERSYGIPPARTSITFDHIKYNYGRPLNEIKASKTIIAIGHHDVFPLESSWH